MITNSDLTGSSSTVSAIKALIAGLPDNEHDMLVSGLKPRKYKDPVQVLIALGSDTNTTRLFHSPQKEAYAQAHVGEYWEVYPVDSAAFREILKERYYKQCKHESDEKQLETAIARLASIARRESPKKAVELRVAKQNDTIYIDLGDDTWRVIEVTKQGWRIISLDENAQVLFWRHGDMMALPIPQKDGKIEPLFNHINVGEQDKPLVAGWLLAALTPGISYPVLTLIGQAGSGKTTAASMLRSLIDPCTAMDRREPKDHGDLDAAVKHNWVLFYNNIEALQHWLSNAFCRISSDGGHAGRQLYTDDKERSIKAKRPIILTAISNPVNRKDLADRATTVTLKRFQDGFEDATEILKRFEADKPQILGGLLDALVAALANIDSIPQKQPVRMAGYVRWVQAAEIALPWKQGAFLEAYLRNHTESTGNEAKELMPNALPVVSAFIAFARVNPGWQDTPTRLLALLPEYASLAATQSPQWPRSAAQLRIELVKAASHIAKQGVRLEKGKRKSTGVTWQVQCNQASNRAA